MKNRHIDLDLFVGASATLLFTNMNGGINALSLDDFAGVRTNKNGVTVIDYHTGNPDFDLDIFYVKESEDEVQKIVADAERMVAEAIEKHEVKLKK